MWRRIESLAKHAKKLWNSLKPLALAQNSHNIKKKIQPEHMSGFWFWKRLLPDASVKYLWWSDEVDPGWSVYTSFFLFFTPGWNFIPVFLRGCLQAKFDPGMKLVPGRNHPCLWWNVSYCLHVFAEMKFHPGMNSSLSKRQEWNFIPGWKKEKKTCKHFIPGWNFKMSMFF